MWKDRWIPGLNIGRISFPGLVEEELPRRVADIINKEKEEWELDPTEHRLDIEERKTILEIPLSCSKEKDRLVWPHTVNGQYTVKSGYRERKKKLVCYETNISSSMEGYMEFEGPK